MRVFGGLTVADLFNQPQEIDPATAVQMLEKIREMVRKWQEDDSEVSGIGPMDEISDLVFEKGVIRG